MAVLFALSAAVLNGSADFFGALASRRTRMAVVVVVAWSQLFGLFVALAISLTQGARLIVQDLIWGGLAGIALALALLVLYQGFRVGRVSVVSPVAAVGSAALPMAWGVVTGERPSVVALCGAGLGLVAISQIARSHAEPASAGRARTAGVSQGLGAGFFFGVCFTLLSFVQAESGMWPIVAARASAVVVMAVVVVVMRADPRPAVGGRQALAWCGALSVLGQGAFVIATQKGMLSVVVVLTSLYPAATVALARIVDRELLNRAQFLGMGLALASVGLIVAG